MADISDVEQAVADTVTSILYPAGIDASSIIGVLCRVYRGWPNAATLNSDLNAGVANISISMDNESGKSTTRYLPEWRSGLAQPGVQAVAHGQTIAISGGPTLGDVVGALIDGKSHAYRIVMGDSADLVASNLASLIRTTRFATVRHNAINIPGASLIQVRVVCDNPAFVESRRQEKDVRISCWCPTPEVRDAVAAAIDHAMDEVPFLALPNDAQARIIYRNTSSYDQAQTALLYRRDLIYTVEYPTIAIVMQPSMLFGAVEIGGNITYG